MSTTPHVIDVTEATFERDVVAQSHQQPVLVDFWAPWCGPCRMLTPVLERLAEEGNGRWRLAKVNSDENPTLARRFNVRGIPNVKAFKDGELVDEFVGALPRPQVQSFLDKLLPSALDEQVAEVRRLMSENRHAEARSRLELILKNEPNHDAARLALAEVALAEGTTDEALRHLAAIPARGPLGSAAEGLRARLRFAGKSERSLPELQEAVAASPDDLEQRYALAKAAVRAGEYDLGARQLLAILERDPQWNGGRARQSMLDLFLVMGEADPRTENYRKRMGWLLFA